MYMVMTCESWIWQSPPFRVGGSNELALGLSLQKKYYLERHARKPLMAGILGNFSRVKNWAKNNAPNQHF
jgi:hypothetical protein